MIRLRRWPQLSIGILKLLAISSLLPAFLPGCSLNRDAGPTGTLLDWPLSRRLARLEQDIAGREPRSTRVAYRTERVKAALDEVFSTIEEIHPNHLDAFSDADAYHSLKESAHRWIDDLAVDDAISSVDAALILYSVVAMFGDGHTSIDSHGRYPHGFRNMFDGNRPPFVLGLRAGEYRLMAGSGALREHVGSVIAEIEGVHPSRFLESILLRISAETLPFALSVFEGSQGFYFDLVALFDNKESVSVTLADGTSVSEQVINPQQFRGLVLSSMSAGSDVRTSSARMLSDDVAYFDWRVADSSPSGIAAIESAFELATTGNAKQMIVDLRFNGGGTSSAGAALLGHFAHRPWRSWRSHTIRASTRIIESGDYALDPAQLGARVTRENLSLMSPNDNRFRGQVHILTGPQTYSAAAAVANAARAYGLATIWGEPPGGPCSAFGNSIDVPLSLGSLNLRVSSLFFACPEMMPNERTTGITPDMVATPETLRYYRDEYDPVLSWVLSELGRSE